MTVKKFPPSWRVFFSFLVSAAMANSHWLKASPEARALLRFFTPEILRRQPNWGYYLVWAGMVRNTLRKQYEALMNERRGAISRGGRAASMYAGEAKPVNFSGRLVLNEEKSNFDKFGIGDQPTKLDIMQEGDTIDIKKTMISEYNDRTIVEQLLTLDGKEKEFKARGRYCADESGRKAIGSKG